MKNAVFIGLSQQVALKRRLDMTANNLANVNTTAFKAEHPLFEEFLIRPMNHKAVSFVQDYGSYRDLREGEFTHTGRPISPSAARGISPLRLTRAFATPEMAASGWIRTVISSLPPTSRCSMKTIARLWSMSSSRN